MTTVELRDVNPSSELTGRVEAIHHVEIRPRVSGYVTAVRYREGSEVAAGTVMFTIDRRPYQAALSRASADLARMRAKVDIAKVDADRADKLVAARAIARAERDTLASTASQAGAELKSAQAAVELARLDVEFTSVRAPMAGRTGQAMVSVGDFVAAGPDPTLLTTLVSVDPVHVYFTGDEQTYLRFAAHADAAAVSVGLADEVGYPHQGVVDFIDNAVDPATGTIRARAVVPNPDHRLAPGLYARVRLPEGNTIKAMLVDDKAILTDQDRKYVYVLGPGDTVERRDLKLGRIIDRLRVVTDGLEVGDRVIVNGIQKVFPGAKVTVAPAATATAAAETTGARSGGRP
ncbi:MAG TPA: efflux RND transporter periplasmic adaptor subunit [Kofleriaceae bacterium]|nr:efflux RND transporter periplasmic adaptor subunit [Kofleriaceae bacterium]